MNGNCSKFFFKMNVFLIFKLIQEILKVPISSKNSQIIRNFFKLAKLSGKHLIHRGYEPVGMVNPLENSYEHLLIWVPCCPSCLFVARDKHICVHMHMGGCVLILVFPNVGIGDLLLQNILQIAHFLYKIYKDHIEMRLWKSLPIKTLLLERKKRVEM